MIRNKAEFYPDHLKFKEIHRSDADPGDYRPHAPRDWVSLEDSPRVLRQLLGQIGLAVDGVAYYLGMQTSQFDLVLSGKRRLPYAVQYALEQWAAYDADRADEAGKAGDGTG